MRGMNHLYSPTILIIQKINTNVVEKIVENGVNGSGGIGFVDKPKEEDLKGKKRVQKITN